MKSHISATIDDQSVEELRRFGQQERRSRSQIIEMALQEFLHKRGGTEDQIETSAGRFEGRFSQEEIYTR
jgi:metal-responsive CopG/Arc/MetJ family transcriptional regulator